MYFVINSDFCFFFTEQTLLRKSDAPSDWFPIGIQEVAGSNLGPPTVSFVEICS